jgi:predicted transport protein
LTELSFMKSLSDTEIKEVDIQKLFEKHSEDFEEGLRYVSSFVGIGSGIIDTLAIDDDFRPVIIEYKKPGNSEEDALIQALHYYYWCSTHFEWIVQAVKKYKPEMLKGADNLDNDIRIMIVAGEYGEHVKGAANVVEPDTQLVEYDIVGGEKKGIVFKTIVDSSRADKIVHQPKAENDHFSGKEHLKPIYELIKEKMLSLGPDVKIGTPTQDYIPIIRRVIFCQVHVKKKWIRLDLRNVKDSPHPKIKPYPVGDWVYVHIEKKNDLDEIIDVVKKAYERAS